MRRLALVALTLVLAACGEDRQPPRGVEIRLTADPEVVVFDGRRMDRAGLEKELEFLARENRSEITRSSRARISIRVEKGATQRDGERLAAHCFELGLRSVTVSR